MRAVTGTDTVVLIERLETDEIFKEISDNVEAQPLLFVSSVWLKCPICRVETHSDLVVPEPDFNEETSSEMASDDMVEIKCNHCEELLLGHANVIPGHCSIKLYNYADTVVHADTPSYASNVDNRDWEDYVLPENPHQIFKSTIGSLKGILVEHVNEHTRNLFNRMIFSQAITAFEAYFCDTLIKNVTFSKSAMLALLKKDSSLSAAKFPLSVLLENPNIVKREIEKSLKNRLYHKVDEVTRLYSNALGISITPNREDLQRLKVDIGYRHDCVHRNGMDKEGNRLKVLTTDYVAETLEVVERFVDHTEDSFQDDYFSF